MEYPLEVLDARAFCRWVQLAEQRLGDQRARIDALNVFPVADGDTGTNLWLTLSAARKALTAEGRPLSLHKAAGAAARGALMGARGNSGVILSQFLQGLASYVAAPKRGEALDGAGLAQALEVASKAAYEAVLRPVEGTILTVGREAARSARKAADGSGSSLRAVVEAAVAGAARAVRRSPGLLAPLARAGVVDAGGEGLRLVLEALREVVVGAGEGAEGAEAAFGAGPGGVLPGPGDGSGPPAGSLALRYCTQMVIRGNGRAASGVRRAMARWGDSVAVARGEGLIKVHLHTGQPAQAMEAARQWGELVSVAVFDMQEQNRERGGDPEGETLPGARGPSRGCRWTAGRPGDTAPRAGDGPAPGAGQGVAGGRRPGPRGATRRRAGTRGEGGSRQRTRAAPPGAVRTPRPAHGGSGAPVAHGHPPPVD